MEKGIQHTIRQYDEAFSKCREIFVKKTRDYGTSWRMLRPKSITDQLYIKAKRIRTIDEKGTQKVAESIEGEFEACVNYGIMALIQLQLDDREAIELTETHAMQLFDEQYNIVKELMLAKNHDYGEAWREMRISSDTDLILTKLHRVKQIEDNKGKTLISEGVDGHYKDIINYSIFALIKLEEQKK
ncbi:MAG: DUF1599 domain-containing protein [Chitinophagales bacterium]|jgi:hypothetical protein|nr:DUF1599 domain-containing protein [Chitinophagales bacterium]